jgi:putative membrane protein
VRFRPIADIDAPVIAQKAMCVIARNSEGHGRLRLPVLESFMRYHFLTSAAASLVVVMAISATTADLAHAQRDGVSRRVAQAYVEKVGAADLYEIASSRVAVRRAERAEVREMAQTLIADHTRSTEEVVAAARIEGFRPGPALMEPRQQMMIRQLERAHGRSFDRLFLSQQISAHGEALTLHRTYSQRGESMILRGAASAIIPVVEGHLEHARTLSQRR